MKQIQYQQKAVKELVDKTIDLLTYSGMRHTLVFKAPTGAGKTVMASEMLLRLNAELRDRTDVPYKELAYIWIAPNKLHEQSYFKMKSSLRKDRSCILSSMTTSTILPRATSIREKSFSSIGKVSIRIMP